MSELLELRNNYLCSLSVRNSTLFLPPVLEYLNNLTSSLGFTAKKQNKIHLAVEEALLLRIDGAYSQVGLINIDFLSSSTQFKVIIKDSGTPFLLNTEDKTNFADILIEKYADEFHINTQIHSGLEFELVFNYDVDDFDITKLQREDYKTETLEDENIRICQASNKMADSEIVQIITAVHSVYGYSYVRDKLYSVYGFRELLHSDTFASWIATNDHKQVLAHCSLDSGSSILKRVPDIGALVTKSMCRGKKIAERMITQLLDDNKDKPFLGFRTEPITIHPYAQKIFTSLGFVPTGFIFHAIPDSVLKLNTNKSHRYSLSLCQRMNKDERVHKVIMPEDNKDFIQDRFNALGLKVEELTAPTTLPSSFSVSYEKEVDSYTCHVSGLPFKTEQNFFLQYQDLRLYESKLITVYLNMNNYDSLASYKYLEESHFFLSGLVVGGEEGDYLVMQHLMRTPLEVDNLKLVPEFASVLERIKKNIMPKEMIV